ncbi:MAG: SPOR domain-containing protein [Candidatus Rokuibacteriota bacterium]
MASSGRRRGGPGPGKAQWIVLGGAVLVILALTFALGLLIGRQWARQTVSTRIGPTIATVSEPARKPAASPRRSGIAAEMMADQAPESTEKLTFYQTLTEPLEGPAGPPKAEAKAVAVKIPTPPHPAPPEPAPPPAVNTAHPSPAAPPPPVVKPSHPSPAATTPAPSLPPRKPANGKPGDDKAAADETTDRGSAGAIATSWTIQVGAYKNRRQADDSRQHLVAAGLDAYMVTLAAQEGQARYRVRIGTYRTREAAAAAAERLRAQRSLTTFVTPR